jgi:hypothetical protein
VGLKALVKITGVLGCGAAASGSSESSKTSTVPGRNCGSRVPAPAPRLAVLTNRRPAATAAPEVKLV